MKPFKVGSSRTLLQATDEAQLDIANLFLSVMFFIIPNCGSWLHGNEIHLNEVDVDHHDKKPAGTSQVKSPKNQVTTLRKAPQ